MLKNLFRKYILKRGSSYSKNTYDVIIHVGAPKAGSSAIQNFLLDSKNTLEKYGYYYPSHGQDINNISGGHSGLGNTLIKEEYEEAKKLYNTYIREAKAKNCILLLSSEFFYNHASKFKEIVGNESIKIIMFHRNPLESLFSNYNQGVKRHFQTVNFVQYCKNILAQKQIPDVTNRVTQKWQEYFGIQNVKIQPYDKKEFTKISIQEIFLESIEMKQNFIENIKPKEIKIVNKSYSSVALEFKRILNNVLDQNNTKENHEIDWYLQSYSDETDEIFMPHYELPIDLIVALEEKFSTKLDLSLKHNFSYSKRLQSILYLVETVKKEKPVLYKYIHKCIEEYIESNNVLSYDIKQLCTWFDIYTESVVDHKIFWFTQNQLNNIAEGKYKEADFLRDIAVMLKNKGDTKNAIQIINKAFELRPNGAFIKKFKEEMENKK